MSRLGWRSGALRLSTLTAAQVIGMAACPLCGARAGSPCDRSGERLARNEGPGHRSSSHQARVRAARQAVR